MNIYIYNIYAFPAAAATLASSAAATAGLTFLPSFHRTLGGGARFRRPSRDRTRTTGMEQHKSVYAQWIEMRIAHRVNGWHKRRSMRF